MKVFSSFEHLESLRRAGIEEKESEAIIKSIENIIVSRDLITTSEISSLKKEIKLDLLKLKIELQAFIIKAVMTSVIILSSLQTLFHFLGRNT